MTFETARKRTVYVAYNTPVIKKVVEYQILDGRRVHSNEFDVEIMNQAELEAFADRNEQSYN